MKYFKNADFAAFEDYASEFEHCLGQYFDEIRDKYGDLYFNVIERYIDEATPPQEAADKEISDYKNPSLIARRDIVSKLTDFLSNKNAYISNEQIDRINNVLRTDAIKNGYEYWVYTTSYHTRMPRRDYIKLTQACGYELVDMEDLAEKNGEASLPMHKEVFWKQFRDELMANTEDISADFVVKKSSLK
jgi:hypothetical protein